MREFGGEALKEIELIATGPQIGVRETRRVKGLYVLTEQDAKDGPKVRGRHRLAEWIPGYRLCAAREDEDSRRTLPRHRPGGGGRPAGRRAVHLGHARGSFGGQEHGQLYGHRPRGRARSSHVSRKRVCSRRTRTPPQYWDW